MSRSVKNMADMVADMNERRKALNREKSAVYQYGGEDKFSILYFNQQRDAAFAKARLPPFGDGSVVYVPDDEPDYLLPVAPAGVRPSEWRSIYRYQYQLKWKDWHEKRRDLNKQYLEACGIILTMLGSGPLTEVQQFTAIEDGMTRFTQITDVIRRKYYPRTSLEIETLLEWISKSSDEFGIRIWFSLWQESIDLLMMVSRRSSPSNKELIRFIETGMTNREMKLYFGTIREQRVPDLRVGAVAGATRKRKWTEIRDEMLRHLDADPSIEAHLISTPKAREAKLTANAAQTFAMGTCFNCGDPGHMMRECTALSCSRCGKIWSSDKVAGFHRCGDKGKCPAWVDKSGRQVSTGSKPTSKSGSGTNSSQSSSIGQKVVTKKEFKTHFRTGKGEGFKAAIAMLKSGKTVADLENSVLGKTKRSE